MSPTITLARRSTVVRTLLGLALALASLVPSRAQAFCGFYVSGSAEQLVNRATRVALMREGTRTVLSMSNDYQGPPQDFAMVVPVPIVLRQQNVRTLPHDVFDRVEALTAPRLVEYWEQDPCYVPPPMDAVPAPTASAAPSRREARAEDRADLGVRIEARFAVGEYQVLVLSAAQSSGLETWLHQNHYNIPQGAARYLAPYVRDQWKFFVARVDIHRVQRRPDGSARLSPLRFHYDSPDFRLPVRLGLLNAPDAQDLLVYVIHPRSRFEVANYRNVFIPTNLDVTDTVRGQFPGFYARLFDQTMASAGGRAVVTEYAWDTGTCDPCPTQPLGPQELATLGADALPSASASYHGGVMAITRLHTRYNRGTLTEDLVFREAPAVVGGREHAVDANGGLEQGAQPASYGSNNFQARYAIRHPWTGPIRCAHPRRGVWGGPPSGQQAAPPQAARDLATAPRAAVDLRSVVRTPVPALGLSGRAAPGEGGGVRTPVRIQIAPPGAGGPRSSIERAPGRLSPLRASRVALAFLSAAAGALVLIGRRRG